MGKRGKWEKGPPTRPPPTSARKPASPSHIVAAIAEHQLRIRASIPAVQADRPRPLRLLLLFLLLGRRRDRGGQSRSGAGAAVVPAVRGPPSSTPSEPLHVFVSPPRHHVEPGLAHRALVCRLPPLQRAVAAAVMAAADPSGERRGRGVKYNRARGCPSEN